MDLSAPRFPTALVSHPESRNFCGPVGYSLLSALGPLGAPAPPRAFVPEETPRAVPWRRRRTRPNRGRGARDPRYLPSHRRRPRPPRCRPPTPTRAAARRRRSASTAGTTGTRAGTGRRCRGGGRARCARPAVGGWRREEPSRWRGADLPAAGGQSPARSEPPPVCACARRGRDGARAGRAAREPGA